MKKTRKLLSKVISAAMSAAMIGGLGVNTAFQSYIGANVEVSAVESSPVVTVGDFQYVLYSDKTAHVVGYVGTKDMSTKNFGMPAVVYSKNVDTTWSYNSYIGSYNITQMEASIFNGCKIKSLSLPRYLRYVMGGFKGAEIGAFFIDSSNTYLSSYYYSGVYGLYDKDHTTLYAYPSKPSLYVSSTYTTAESFPTTLKRIEDRAFENSKYTNVKIPASVTYMGDSVFTGSNIQTVEFKGNAPTFRFMPSSVIPDHGTFEGASNLYKITIDGKDGSYNTDSYGMVYNKDMTKLVLVPQGKSNAFNVASTCTEIGDYAFYHSKANGPVIYDNVKTIGRSAFYGIKSGFKIYCIKDTPIETFAKNKNIPYAHIFEYTVSDSMANITAYNGPYSGPSVPSKLNGYTVTAIGENAFKGNTSLVGIYMSNTRITSIGEKAFSGCSKLVNISMPSTVTSIGKNAFNNVAATNIVIPSSMKEIGDYAFQNCGKLTSLNIPSNVTKIGSYAFGFCSSLESVSIPNKVETIGSGAFYGCTSLTSLTIGSGVKTIGAYSFENTGLTSQYIPRNVTTVGGYSFGYSYADSKHTRNSDFTEISGYPSTAAQTYAKNYDIPFKSLMAYEKSSDGKSIKITRYTGTETSLTIPSTIEGLPVTNIDKYAFNGNTTIQTVTLPDTMTNVSSYAFYGCYGLKKVVLPSTIKNIYSYAFEFCSSLTTINFPTSLAYIGSGAFYGCTSLSSVNISSCSNLKTIGSSSFCNTALKNIRIPKNVKTIYDHAFGFNYKNSEFIMVDDFYISGYAYSAADSYATNSGITFYPEYESVVNTSTIDKTILNFGESAVVTASATGGKLPFTYSVSYKKEGESWVTIQDYSTNSNITVKPSSWGNYTVLVNVKDARNYIVSKYFYIEVDTDDVTNTSKIWIGENEGQTTLTVDDTVGIQTGATGGNGEYTYSIYYHNKGADNWQTAIEGTDRTAVSLRLTTGENGEVVPGEYEILVIAYDSDNKYDQKTFVVTVEALTPLKNTSTISKKTIGLGETVTLKCNAEGGKAPYQFAVYYKLSTASKWTTAQSYKENKTVKFTPKHTGKYNVSVKVKDADGTIVKKTFTVTVADALKNNTTISATEINEGKSVTVSCSASGGKTSYQFAVYYKLSTASKWTTAQSYKENSTVKITPKKNGTYDISVKVKDADGTIVKKAFIVTVIS